MATIAQRLSFEEFELQYGSDSKTHEYWYGEAIPRSMPTWLHGKLQIVIGQLLREAGFAAGSEVELRVISEAHPRPDVSAFFEEPADKYPTQPPDVVVEIISPDDKISVVREHCQKYEDWGCKQIYLVYPEERRVLSWVEGSELIRLDLAGIPVAKIWGALDTKASK